MYEIVVDIGRIPNIREIDSALEISRADLEEGLSVLVKDHYLVMQPSGEILMAQPFSAIPTPFVVSAETKSWYAPCIWDALGIAAMINEDVTIQTSCGDCCDRITLSIASGLLREAESIIHFSVQVQHW